VANKSKVSETVRFIIHQNAIYQFLVNSGLVNSNALARQIKEAVNAMTGKEVRVNTIAKVIANMKPPNAKPYIGLLDVDVALDTDVAEVDYSLDDFKKIDLKSVFLALVNGERVNALVKRGESVKASDIVLLKVIFRGGATAYHPFWLLFNSLGIEVMHIIRHDNTLFIFLKRSDAIQALTVIEKFSSNSLKRPSGGAPP